MTTTAIPARGTRASWWLQLLFRMANAVRLHRRPEHRRRVARSRSVLGQLRSFEGEATGARCFAYLRKVDPWLFEEVMLSALEDCGVLVWRNTRYTGDGGVDGRFYVSGVGWGVLQAKRYEKHVDAGHVEAFAQLLHKRRMRLGIFVHTGRTGRQSWSSVRGTAVLVVSGAALIELVRERRLSRVIMQAPGARSDVRR